MSNVVDEICAGIERRLAPTNLTFALVLWVKGEEANPSSVALSASPSHQSAAPTALRTTATAADPAGERPRLTPEESAEVLELLRQEREVLARSYCAEIEPGQDGWDLSTIDDPEMRTYIDRWDRAVAALERITRKAEAA